MENFCVKRVMVKAGIPLSICEETICGILQKAGLKWTQVQRKGILTKNDLKLRLETKLKKFAVNVQCQTMKYEFMRKPMVLERVEVNSLKVAHY